MDDNPRGFCPTHEHGAEKLHIYIFDGLEEAAAGVIPCFLQVSDRDNSHSQVWLVNAQDGSINRRVLPQAVLYYQAEAVASYDGRRFYLREHDFYGNNPQNRYDGRDLADHVYDLVNDREFSTPRCQRSRVLSRIASSACTADA